MAGSGASYDWYYLDSTREEFGPYPSETMHSWLRQGLFPIGGDLMVRLPEWKDFVRLKTIYPNVDTAHDAFVGPPRAEGVARSDGTNGGGAGGGNQRQRRGARGAGGGAGGVGDASQAALMQQMGGGCCVGGPNAAYGHLAAAGGMQQQQFGGPGGPFLMDPSSAALGMIAGGACLGGMPGLVPAPYTGDFNGQMPVLQPLHPVQMQQQALQQPAGPPANGSGSCQRDRRFQGRIKSYSSRQGFGFIESPEAFSVYGRDVFLHRAQIGDLAVHTQVTFLVDLNKEGMPQARHITTLDGRLPGPMPDLPASQQRGDSRGDGKAGGEKGGRGRGGKGDGGGKSRGGRKGGGGKGGGPPGGSIGMNQASGGD